MSKTAVLTPGQAQCVTPKMAQSWLAHNLSNRKVRQTVVDRYAADMKANCWHVTSAGIAFDIDGNLVDGQHRLMACVQAGVPFTTFVVRNVDNAARVAMDTGLARSLADVLTWQGETSAKSLGGALNAGWAWQNGFLQKAGAPSHEQVLRWFDHNPSIRDAVADVSKVAMLFHAPRGVLAAFVHQIRLIDQVTADDFLERLTSGNGLENGDPVLAARNWMLNIATRQSRAMKPSKSVYLAMLIKAWNYWVTGHIIKVLSWKRQEDFPLLVDLTGQSVEVRSEKDDEG